MIARVALRREGLEGGGLLGTPSRGHCVDCRADPGILVRARRLRAVTDCGALLEMEDTGARIGSRAS